MTFRDETTNVTRDLFNSFFRPVNSAAGHPIAAYLPSDGTPLFVIEKSDDGWFIFSSAARKNRALLDGSGLDAGKREIIEGSRLEIYSVNEGRVVGAFVFKCS